MNDRKKGGDDRRVRNAPRILLSNDDGINAPGLKTLEKIARELTDDYWIVAPESEQSGASHSLTLTTPLRLREVSKKKFAVQGTPTDSVVMAVVKVLEDDPPDLLLSGVNRGSNIADDVTYSGTIAAAMEGTVLGIKSIALSQTYGSDGHRNIHWQTAERYGPKIVRQLLDIEWGSDVLFNVNFPDATPDHVTGIELTRQGKRDQSNLEIEERVDRRGNPYYWTGFKRIASNPGEGTDLRAIYSKRVSITPLHMNLTHRGALKRLHDSFDTEAIERACRKSGGSRSRKRADRT